VISEAPWLRGDLAYSPQTTILLTEAQEWSKLECWMGTVWMVRPPGTGAITEEDLGYPMLLLFHRRSGAARKLKQWVEQRSQKCGEDIPESFQEICKHAHEAAQRDVP